MKVCAQRGCPALTDSTYCPPHTSARRKASDAKRPSARDRGYDHKWQATRARHLHLYPLCVQCGKPATDVDHIDGLGPLGPRGHDETNLRSYCKAHHSQRTARDQPGGWAA